MFKKASSASKKYLKFIGIANIILAILSIISLIVFAVAKGNIFDLGITSDQLNQLHNSGISDDQVRILLCIGTGIGFLFEILIGWLLIRAANNPNKTTLILVLVTLSTISGIVSLFSSGFSNISTVIGNIFNLTIDVLAFMALLRVRRETGE